MSGSTPDQSAHASTASQFVEDASERMSPDRERMQGEFETLALQLPSNDKLSGNPSFARLDSSSHSSQASEWMFDESEIRLEDCLEVGQGSVSKVFKARVRSVAAALKILRQDFDSELSQQQARTDFQNEFTVGLQGLQHPNVVPFLGGCNLVQDGLLAPALLYEYVDGGSVQDVLDGMKEKHGRTWKPPLLLSLSWCSQLCEAIAYLHDFEGGIAHRDIKPANVLVSRSLKELKLCDFSLARPMASVWEDCETEATTIPSIAGSMRYMAPEVLLNKAYDLAKADIYSAATTCWTFIHGEPPFQNLEAAVVCQLARSGARPAIHPKLRDVRSVLDLAWSSTPSQRPSGSDLGEQWQGVLQRRARRIGCFAPLAAWSRAFPSIRASASFP